MSEHSTRKRSKQPDRPSRGRADLERLRQTTESDIRRTAPSELADLPVHFWDEGELVIPTAKQAISLRVDEDVLDWFKQSGPRYQTRMNAVLRSYMVSARKPLAAQARRRVNYDLLLAIADKRLIEFDYKSRGTRVVEPHDYGIKGGVERLLAFQLGGHSGSKAPHGWKWFDVAEMRELRVLERRFRGSRGDSAQHHSTWDTLFARVA